MATETGSISPFSSSDKAVESVPPFSGSDVAVESVPSILSSAMATESNAPPTPIFPAGFTPPIVSPFSTMATESVVAVSSSAGEDATKLNRAFKGFRCDSGTILNILGRRNASELVLIAKEYRNMYSEDLKERVSSELRGDLKKAVLLWMHDPAGRDATALGQALSGVTDLKGVSEVICSRTPSQIQQFKQAYRAMFDVHLEYDIEQKASGDHRKLLLAYLAKIRSESKDVDEKLVDEDARVLYQAGEKKLGTDEETFIRIFSERSWAHLAAVNSAYFRMYGNSLKKAVKKETSGKFRFSLLTILQCAENPGKYFAKALNAAMKGLGTDTTTLTRIIVTRAEVDMRNIEAEYGKKFGKSLNDAVHSDTSGDYRTFLLALLGHGQTG